MSVKQSIIKEISHSGPLSRAELSRRLGICPSRITEVCATLIKNGLLCHIGYRKSDSRGRKSLLLDIDCSYKFALGVGITGDTVSVGLTTLKGDVLGKESLVLDKKLSFETAFEAIKHISNKILSDCCLDKDKLLGVGVSLTSQAVSGLGLQMTRQDLPEQYRSFDGVPVLFEPLDEYLEYAGQYLDINKSELFMFGCAKVTRDLFIYAK